MSTVKKSVREILTNRVNEVLEDKDLKFSKKQIEAIMLSLEPTKGGGGGQSKVNEEGLVYCNYFKEYMHQEEFKKTPQGKWPPMSINGTKLKSKLNTLDKQMNREISEAFIKGIDINKEELIAKYEQLKAEVK